MNIKHRLLTFVVSCCIALIAAESTPAADYDLFMNPGVSDVSRPNVLIVLDNSANWSSTAKIGSGRTAIEQSKFDFEKEALTNFFITKLKPGEGEDSKYNVGLMLFSESGGGNALPDGGYVRYAVREMNANNATALASLIANLDRNNDKGNATEYAHAMHEALLYFQGANKYSGDKVKTDGGRPVTITNPANYNPNDGGAWSAKPRYRSPTESGACGKNYVIVIANGKADSGENNAADDLLDDFSGRVATDPIDLTPSGAETNWADEFARLMYQNGIQTYTIDVIPGLTGMGPDNTALYKSMANQGNGRYFAVTEAGGDWGGQLSNILDSIFNEIQAVSNVFASSALPVSVNVRGTNENQVYIGMFQPDANREPRWIGNIKQYQLQFDTALNGLDLYDSTGNTKVQSDITGFVVPEAISYWTLPSTYWAPSPRGTPESASDSPDGEVIEKGATAQMQRNQLNGRTLYTCSGTGATCNRESLAASHFGNDTALFEWLKGLDNVNPLELDVETDHARPSIHGDVMHAAPAIVNYGGGANQFVTFYGSNDGLYHAVRAGQNDVTGAGQELWAFVAPEFVSKIARLRNNTPLIKVPHNSPNPEQSTATNRDFFFDGGTAIYQENAGTGDINTDDNGNGIANEVYIYLIARRGGRLMYAMDVTDPTNPVIKWRRTQTDTGWSELGETWSLPAIAKVNYDGTPTPVLIFGAGYDPNADDPIIQQTATMGRGVFVVRASDGQVLHFFNEGMTYAVPSTVAVADVDGDELADVAYVGDMGGQVWRMNFGDTWTMNKVANFSGGSRKFLYAPELTLFGGSCPAGAGDKTIGVMIGAGDREHPLAMSVYNETFEISASEAQNQFYLFKDQDYTAAPSEVIDTGDLIDATDVSTAVDLTTEVANSPCNGKTCGWLINFDTAEKVVGGSVITGGVIYFGTSIPPAPVVDPNTCSGNLGEARIYQVNYCNAAPYAQGTGSNTVRYEIAPGGGLLPPPIRAVITAPNANGEMVAQTAVLFGLNAVTAPPAPEETANTGKTFWYRLRN